MWSQILRLPGVGRCRGLAKNLKSNPCSCALSSSMSPVAGLINSWTSSMPNIKQKSET